MRQYPVVVFVAACTHAPAQTPVDRACADFTAGAPETQNARCRELATHFKSADVFVRCAQYYIKSRPMSDEIHRRAGIAPLSRDKQLDLLAGCEASTDGPAGPDIRCVADSRTEAEARACTADIYPVLLRAATASSDRPEAVRELEHIGELAKAFARRTGAFPHGSAPAPTSSCCTTRDKLCPVEGWDAAPWKELGYQQTEPTLFQYGYEGDGTTFTAVAIGDMDCDTIQVRYTLTGRIDHGEPAVTLTKPPPGTD